MLNVRSGLIEVETKRHDMKITPNNIFYTLQNFESNNPSIDKLLQNFSSNLNIKDNYVQSFSSNNSINLSELTPKLTTNYFREFDNISSSDFSQYVALSYQQDKSMQTQNDIPDYMRQLSIRNNLNVNRNYTDLNRIFHYQSLYERYLTSQFNLDDPSKDNYYTDVLENLGPEISRVVSSLDLYLGSLEETFNGIFTVLNWLSHTLRLNNHTSEANSLLHIQAKNLKMIFDNLMNKLELLSTKTNIYEKTGMCYDSTTASETSTTGLSPDLSISNPDEMCNGSNSPNTFFLNNNDDNYYNRHDINKQIRNIQKYEQRRSFKHTFPKEWLEYDFPSIQGYDKPAQLKFLASANVVGRLFDYNGEHIRVLQNKFNVKISTSGNRIFYPGTGKQVLLIEGRLVHIMYAIRTVFFMMIPDILDVSKLPDYFNADSIKFEISVVIPSSTSNKILSSRGSYIQRVQQQTNARIHVTCMRFEMDDIQERLACITGSQSEVEKSIELISLLIQEDQNKENYDFLQYPLYTKAHIN